MNIKSIIQFLIMIPIAIKSCARSGPALPVIEDLPAEEMQQATDSPDLELSQAATGKCGRSSEEVRLLIHAVHGYCLEYPSEYDVIYPNESEVVLFTRSILNTSEPMVSIRVEPAGEVTLEQAADQVAEMYAIPGTPPTRVHLTIDGEEAILLSGLSGQDPNSQVVVLHNDLKYTLFFIEMNRDQGEVYAQFERLFDTVIGSFNFHPESNACPDCPTSDEGPQSAMISGWVWHDQCDSGEDGQPAPAEIPPGCVNDESPLGSYHADGILTPDESLIEGVVVTLGVGACPSSGLAQAITIITDLSYSFSGLGAGEYCVSIDPQQEPNFAILRPGLWIYPFVTQDVVSATVKVAPGEYVGMVNFGWDYQFQH